MALIAFDGATCRLNRNSAKNSNVGRFFDAYDSPNKRYYPGGRARIFELPGMSRGERGGDHILDQAHRSVTEFCSTGDCRIDIAGLGCGGALALELSHRIANDPELNQVELRFLALWDIVLPNRELCPHNDDHHHRSVHASVFRAAHAMAIDEARPEYAILRQSRAYEVWFRGAHDDVGGCNGSPGLADITLRWMLKKALLLRLPIRRDALDRIEPDVDAAVSQHGDSSEFGRRDVLDNDRVHQSVGFRLGPEYNNPDPERVRIRR